MSVFITTDGSRIEWLGPRPTIKAVVELFNYIWECEREGGARDLQTPLDDGGGVPSAGGSTNAAEYNYRD